MEWFIDDDVAQTLIDYGFGAVVADLDNQFLSLCGSNMNVLDSAGNTYSLTYDSLGYINPQNNVYLAPAQNFAYGCGFEFACNYDPCAIYDFDLCEFLEVSVETTTDDGSGNGSATASVEGGVEPYSYAWFEGLSENSFASTMSVDNLLAGDYSVLAVDSTGCVGSLDFVIDMVNAVEALDATWTVFPNPATDALQVQVTTLGEGQLVMTDLHGREVLRQALRDKNITLDLSSLPAGSYVLSHEQGKSRTTRRIQVIR